MMYSIGSKTWPGLSKIAEEFGEVLQVIGKIIGCGGERIHFSGSDLRNDLIEELADARAAIAYFERVELTAEERAEIADRTRRKFDLFMQWHEGNSDAR